MNQKFALFVFISTLVFSSLSWGQSRGGGRRGVSLSGEHSLTLGIGFIGSEQNNMDDVIDAQKGSGSLKNFGNAYEYFLQYGIRFDKSWLAFVFRPSFFTQETDGTCTNGNCKSELSGMAFFPMLKMIPLENEFIKLFFQVGLGYGQLEGSIKDGSNNVKFKGSAFGAMGGLGVDFCFTEMSCFSVEGNLRYLPIERNLVTSASGTVTGVTGTASGAEIERNSNSSDLSTTMSGLQGLISYTMMF